MSHVAPATGSYWRLRCWCPPCHTHVTTITEKGELRYVTHGGGHVGVCKNSGAPVADRYVTPALIVKKREPFG